MGFGLFGKVPQKRDFMSVQMPTAVLSPFETWLQSAVAASRNELGQAWQNHYLVAPIWRFWIGEHILGRTVAGALMPSVDQVGRYFPLAIMYFAEPGDTLPPPLLSPLDHWYGAIEQRLLRALSEETDAYLATILEGLEPPREQAPLFPPLAAIPEAPVADTPPPEAVPPDAVSTEEAATPPSWDAVPDASPVAEAAATPEAAVPEPEVSLTTIADLPDTSPFDDFPPAQPEATPVSGLVTMEFKGGQTLEVPPGQTLSDALMVLRDADYHQATSGRSYFWCAASRLGPARIHGRQGMPDPYFFSRMILWERGPA